MTHSVLNDADGHQNFGGKVENSLYHVTVFLESQLTESLIIY